jgi:hypothetical protein
MQRRDAGQSVCPAGHVLQSASLEQTSTQLNCAQQALSVWQALAQDFAAASSSRHSRAVRHFDPGHGLDADQTRHPALFIVHVRSSPRPLTSTHSVRPNSGQRSSQQALPFRVQRPLAHAMGTATGQPYASALQRRSAPPAQTSTPRSHTGSHSPQLWLSAQ